MEMPSLPTPPDEDAPLDGFGEHGLYGGTSPGDATPRKVRTPHTTLPLQSLGSYDFTPRHGPDSAPLTSIPRPPSTLIAPLSLGCLDPLLVLPATPRAPGSPPDPSPASGPPSPNILTPTSGPRTLQPDGHHYDQHEHGTDCDPDPDREGERDRDRDRTGPSSHMPHGARTDRDGHSRDRQQSGSASASSQPQPQQSGSSSTSRRAAGSSRRPQQTTSPPPPHQPQPMLPAQTAGQVEDHTYEYEYEYPSVAGGSTGLGRPGGPVLGGGGGQAQYMNAPAPLGGASAGGSYVGQYMVAPQSPLAYGSYQQGFTHPQHHLQQHQQHPQQQQHPQHHRQPQHTTHPMHAIDTGSMHPGGVGVNYGLAAGYPGSPLYAYATPSPQGGPSPDSTDTHASSPHSQSSHSHSQHSHSRSPFPHPRAGSSNPSSRFSADHPASPVHSHASTSGPAQSQQPSPNYTDALGPFPAHTLGMTNYPSTPSFSYHSPSPQGMYPLPQVQVQPQPQYAPVQAVHYPQPVYGVSSPSVQAADDGHGQAQAGTWWYLQHPGGVQQYLSYAAMPFPQSQLQPQHQAYQQQQPPPSPSHAAAVATVGVPYHPQVGPRPLGMRDDPPMRGSFSAPPPEPRSLPASDSSGPSGTGRGGPGTGTGGTGSGGTGKAGAQSVVHRRDFHPNPPPQRSEWVMWVGNVPGDATHDELWRFFNQPPPGAVLTAPHSGGGSPSSGVASPNPPFSQASTSPSVASMTSMGGAGLLPSGLLTSPEPPSSASASASSHPHKLASRLSPGGFAPPGQTPVWGGVSSVFLISRSNCAFVNFDSEPHLVAAVARFNGAQIRPSDPRCPRLVCRVRRRDDDMRAGVGGQRGFGMHTRWVQDKRTKDGDGRARGAARPRLRGGESSTSSASASAPTSASASDASASGSPGASFSSGDRDPKDRVKEDAKAKTSGSSGSFASTNSSFLTRYFPQRYFILKSLTQEDLDLSVTQGVWATQSHNEGVLDQAYRTSTDVFLIFSANKSGEFFGYARMAGPITHSGRRISWASRTDSSQHSPVAPLSPTSIRVSQAAEAESSGGGTGRSYARQPAGFLSPSFEIDESPAPMTPGEEGRTRLESSSSSNDSSSPEQTGESRESAAASLAETHARSAPAELLDPHRKLTFDTPYEGPGTMDERQVSRGASHESKQTADLVLRHTLAESDTDFQLNPTRLAEREAQARRRMESHSDVSLPPYRSVDRMAAGGDDSHAAFGAARGKEDDAKDGDAPGGPATWGTPFKIEWIRTDRLPFHRTRNLRNPWNLDREVKVSRDGTEIEPTVGQKLLDEWDKPEPDPSAAVPPIASSRRTGGGRMPRVGGVGPQPTTSTTTSTRSSTTGRG